MKLSFFLSGVVLVFSALTGCGAVLANAFGPLPDDDPFGNSVPKAPRKNPTDDRIDFTIAVSPATAKRGETVKVTIAGTPRPGFHTYPLTQRTIDQDEALLGKLTFNNAPGLKPLFPISETPSEVEDIPGLGKFLEHAQPFQWSRDVLILPEARPGKKEIGVNIRLQVCDKTCVWGEHHLKTAITVSDAPPVSMTSQLSQRLLAKEPPIQVVELATIAGAKPILRADSAPEQVQGTDMDLLRFILQGVAWGAISLLTPCVFPMIPITVSFFLKQSEKHQYRPLTLALVYSLTIVLVLTISAVALLSFFRNVSTNPYMNLALGALFIYFALSLFGMYEIELPSSLTRYTSAREGKGGLTGTIFMALTFTIISFACVAPFLGGFGGTAASSRLSLGHRIFGGLAFSVTFAAPFFFLALFPTLLKKMPKSGSWLNSVKVVMGFLEMAAALKFLRTAELIYLPKPEFFTYDLVLGMFIALSLLCGLYLLNIFRLPYDSPVDHLGVPRLLFSFLFLSLGLYLTPALFKSSAGIHQRPSGTVFAWLDSFLLPEAQDEEVAINPAGNQGQSQASIATLPWIGDLKTALTAAKSKGQLVFVDFTGETCTNCKLNEQNVFSKRSVQDLLKQYGLVQLYTDKVPNKYYSVEQRDQFGQSTTRQRTDAQANLQFQRETFNTEQLPLYVILEPKEGGGFKELARYAEGKINDEAGFIRFLHEPLASAAKGGRIAADN